MTAAGTVFIFMVLSVSISCAIAAAARGLIQAHRRNRLPRPYKEPAWQTRDVDAEVLQDVLQYAVPGEGTKFYLVHCYTCEAMLLTAQWPTNSGSHYEPNSSAAIRAGWNYHDIPGVGSKFLCPNHTRAVRELLAPNA